MLNPKIKKTSVNGAREVYEFTNNKNEKVRIDLSVVHCDPKDKNCLPNQWKKAGYITKPFYDYISIQVEANNEYGIYRKYNPQLSKNGKISFKWMLPDSKANREKILNEVYRLANVNSLKFPSKQSNQSSKLQTYAKSIKDSVSSFGVKLKKSITSRLNKKPAKLVDNIAEERRKSNLKEEK